MRHYQNPCRNRLWFQRFKLKDDGLLSNFAFNFNLRRYMSEVQIADLRRRIAEDDAMSLASSSSAPPAPAAAGAVAGTMPSIAPGPPPPVAAPAPDMIATLLAGGDNAADDVDIEVGQSEQSMPPKFVFSSNGNAHYRHLSASFLRPSFVELNHVEVGLRINARHVIHNTSVPRSLS